MEREQVTERRPFTSETAAEYLGCSARHVRNMCKAGKLGHFYFGKLLRIPADAVDELERAACEKSSIGGSGMPTGETLPVNLVVEPFVPPIIMPLSGH